MTRIANLPVLGLALGAALLMGSSAALAEGDQVDTQSQTQVDDTLDNGMSAADGAGVTTGTEAGTGMDDGTGAPLDSATLREIEDDNVMHDGLTVGEIEGTDVYVGEDDIGEIETVLGDETGTVQAYILSVDDGVFDLDSKKFVVPADRFTFDAENDRFNTQLSQVELEDYETWQ